MGVFIDIGTLGGYHPADAAFALCIPFLAPVPGFRDEPTAAGRGSYLWGKASGFFLSFNGGELIPPTRRRPLRQPPSKRPNCVSLRKKICASRQKTIRASE